MGSWLAVAAGGALGSMGRYWLAGVMTAVTGPRFPWGTLLINIVGSFVIGLLGGMSSAPGRIEMSAHLRTFLMVGVCGGFTTFSSFSLQTLDLLQAGEVGPAFGYAVGSMILCVLGCYAGWSLGRLA